MPTRHCRRTGGAAGGRSTGSRARCRSPRLRARTRRAAARRRRRVAVRFDHVDRPGAGVPVGSPGPGSGRGRGCGPAGSLRRRPPRSRDPAADACPRRWGRPWRHRHRPRRCRSPGPSGGPLVTYSFGSSTPVTRASPWAPPFIATVEMTEVRVGSRNVTPAASATAMRSTSSTRTPGSVPSATAASSALRASPVPGLPRTTVVPGDAGSELRL